MQRFANITKQCIISGNIKRASRCLQVASQLLEQGSDEVKQVVAVVYVHAVSSFMELHHCSIRELFPQSLRNEYLKQVNTGGL